MAFGNKRETFKEAAVLSTRRPIWPAEILRYIARQTLNNMKTTKASTKSVRSAKNGLNAESSVRGGMVKCTVTKKGADGAMSTVEGTCKIDAAKSCGEQLKDAIS